MARNLRKFNTYSDYETAELVRPAVSLVLSPRKVYFDPINPTPPTPTFDGKWKATYSDDHTESAQCDASSAITRYEINKTSLVSVEIGDCVTSIDNLVFQDCSSLTNITIPNSVTSIGISAFQNCSSLTSIDIPSGVTSIGNLAFGGCGSLTSIDIPSGVTSINESTFRSTGLVSITIPYNVTSIGENAFRSCGSLTSITVNRNVPPSLGSQAFRNTNDCPIFVPSGSVNAYKSASGWSQYASRIQAIPNS